MRRFIQSGRTFARMACLLGLLGCSFFASAQSWTLSGPPSRHSHSAVFDSTTSQMIIFGGLETTTNTDLNDVWLGKTATNQSDSFTALAAGGTAPPGRYGHVATYDSVSNRMTIFGGGRGLPAPCANDVWILDGANGNTGSANWLAITPGGSPPAPRLYSGGAYDPVTNSMIVFGGSDCSGGYVNDVWVLSNANGEAGSSSWTQLTPSGLPPLARESGTAVYDSAHNILTVYGGDAGGAPLNDVWVLSHANGTGGTPVWTQLAPGGTAPLARTGHTATYDKANNRMTIFGGINGTITLMDTWVLTSANGLGAAPGWVQLVTQGTAPSVAYHSAVYDSKTNNLYSFAGTSSQDKLGINAHAFTLNGANGLAKTTSKWILGGIPVRYSPAAFFDSSTNSLFVFAGAHATTLLFNDYWQASGVLGSSNLNWVSLLPKGTKPAPRYGHTGVYDSASNRLMLYGGSTGATTCVSDYHVLQQANNQGGVMNWVAVTPSGTPPPARLRQAAVYDSGTNSLILFGGNNCKTTYFNDVWVLTNANDLTALPAWKQRITTGARPTVRQSSSAVYDPTTNTLIVYGGDKGGLPSEDIWLLSHANGTGGNSAWTQLTPSNIGPVARSGHTAIYDSVNNVMTIYGGYTGRTLLNDTWVLSNANGQGGPATWTQLTSGQAIRFQNAVYDPATNQMITFGGATGTVPQNPSSDIYTLTDANGISQR